MNENTNYDIYLILMNKIIPVFDENIFILIVETSLKIKNKTKTEYLLCVKPL